MNQYRLDRRFVLQAIGIALLISGFGFLTARLGGPGWLTVVGWLVGVAMLARAVLLWFRPPVVVRTDESGVTLGGRLTVKPVSVEWSEVERVTHENNRVLFDRDAETVLLFPLAFVGARRAELVTEIYERLNAANGYRRFDPQVE